MYNDSKWLLAIAFPGLWRENMAEFCTPIFSVTDFNMKLYKKTTNFVLENMGTWAEPSVEAIVKVHLIDNLLNKNTLPASW